VLIAVFFLATAPAAYADIGEATDAMMQKLWRGVVNVSTGWMEIPFQIYRGYNDGFAGVETNKIVGLVSGVVDGARHAAGRTLSGAVDIVGFWAASPPDNEGFGSTLDSEYVWDKGEPYAYIEPGLNESLIKPVGKKLVRGVADLIGGVVEVPGQIMKGSAEGAPDLGIIKGIWLFASRELSGAYDIVSAILPTPADAIGVTFEDEYAWSALSEETGMGMGGTDLK